MDGLFCRSPLLSTVQVVSMFDPLHLVEAPDWQTIAGFGDEVGGSVATLNGVGEGGTVVKVGVIVLVVLAGRVAVEVTREIAVGVGSGPLLSSRNTPPIIAATAPIRATMISILEELGGC